MSQDQLRTAAQAALDAIEDFDVQCRDRKIFIPAEIDTAIDALRAALREDAMQRVSDIGQEMENAALAANKPTTPPLRDAAIAALDMLGRSGACHHSLVQSAMSELRQGLLHDKAHIDSGAVRAAQSVRTEMSYRPGSLPMDAPEPIPLHPNLPVPTDTFGKPDTIAQWFICPHCKGESPLRPAEQTAQPVAWMYQHDETGRVGFVEQWQLDHGYREANPRLTIIAPLYTHPAPIGDLSDEEIDKAWRGATIDYTAPYDNFRREVARAIIAAARGKSQLKVNPGGSHGQA